MEKKKIEEFCNKLRKEKTPFIFLTDMKDGFSFFIQGYAPQKGQLCNLLASYLSMDKEMWHCVRQLVENTEPISKSDMN